MSSENLKSLFEPQSVAIIGATNKLQKVGGSLARNALSGSYKGKIYLVNPKLTTIFGHRAYSSLEKLPHVVDLVEICIPSSHVPDIICQAAESGVKAAIIVSSGFAESGNIQLQEKITRLAQQYGIRILGPNSFGFINTALDLDLTFSFTRALKGNIAFLSQSGAMCCGTLDYAYNQGIGFSKFINLGNKCDINEMDIMEYLVNDTQTKVIAFYLEGIDNGRRFVDVGKDTSKVKPLIAVKSGITEAGARAALSHTASLAGRKEIIEGAFKQANIIKVEDIEDLIGGAVALANQPPPHGVNVGIVTNAGGLGVIVTDWCQNFGMTVPLLPDLLKNEIKELIPQFASALNPVDMTGDADYTRYKSVCEKLLNSRMIDLVLSIYTSQGLVTSDGPAHAVAEAAQNSDKPVLALLMGGASIVQGKRILNERNIPVYSFPEKLVKAARTLIQRSNIIKNLK